MNYVDMESKQTLNEFRALKQETNMDTKHGIDIDTSSSIKI